MYLAPCILQFQCWRNWENALTSTARTFCANMPTLWEMVRVDFSNTGIPFTNTPGCKVVAFGNGAITAFASTLQPARNILLTGVILGTSQMTGILSLMVWFRPTGSLHRV